MSNRVKSNIALVGIAVGALIVAQFVPEKAIRYAICLLGGAIAEAVRKKIAAE